MESLTQVITSQFVSSLGAFTTSIHFAPHDMRYSGSKRKETNELVNLSDVG